MGKNQKICQVKKGANWHACRSLKYTRMCWDKKQASKNTAYLFLVDRNSGSNRQNSKWRKEYLRNSHKPTIRGGAWAWSLTPSVILEDRSLFDSWPCSKNVSVKWGEVLDFDNWIIRADASPEQCWALKVHHSCQGWVKASDLGLRRTPG